MRRWNVYFAGDPGYGRETVAHALKQDPYECEAPDASTAARKAVSEWRARDGYGVREEGFYGEGLAVYVREAPEPLPVLTFVRTKGRMKLERA